MMNRYRWGVLHKLSTQSSTISLQIGSILFVRTRFVLRPCGCSYRDVLSLFVIEWVLSLSKAAILSKRNAIFWPIGRSGVVDGTL